MRLRPRVLPLPVALLCVLLLQNLPRPLNVIASPFTAGSARSARPLVRVLVSGTHKGRTVTFPPTATTPATTTTTTATAMVIGLAGTPTPDASATAPASATAATLVTPPAVATATLLAPLPPVTTTPTTTLTATLTASAPSPATAVEGEHASPRPVLRAQASTTVVSTTLTIPATANIFGAGHASPPDPGGAGGGILPPGVSFPTGAGQVLSIGTVSGQVTCNNGGNYTGADGPCLPGGTDINSVEGIAGVVAGQSSMFLVGVFLSAAEPQDPAPSRLDFSAGALGQSFSTLAPQLNQVFFLGDGLTGTGTGQTQQFLVPPLATRLFVGFADAFDFHGDPGWYGDNSGQLTASLLITGMASSGTIPWHPHHSMRLSDGLSASVDLADGHLDLSQADLAIPGRGGSDLDLGHTWDSVLAQAGVTTTAGAGWLDSLTPSIDSLGGMLTGTVSYTDATGAVWSYPYTGSLTATAPYTQYAVPPGDPWQLTTASSGYTLTNPLSGETLTFDSQGRSLADTDSYGNASSVSYSSSLPITWTAAGGFLSPNGRALSLDYTGSGLLSDVQSPLWRKSGGSQGRHVTYGYNGAGQLTSLTRGAGSTDALTTTFGYSGTQLVTVTTPSNRSWLLGYDAAGRIASLTSPLSGTLGQIGYTPAYTTTFAYTPGQTQLVVGAGTTGALTTTYTLDASGEATATSDALNNTSHTSYDQDHDVLTSQDADGNTTTNYYQYVGPSGNIGLITETLSPPVGIDYPWAIPNQWATTYRYDPRTYDLLETDAPGGGITRDSYDGHHSVLTSTVLLAITSPCQAAVQRTAQLRRALSTSSALSTGSGGHRGAPRPAGGVCQSYDYQWRATVNHYDADGELVSTVDGRGLDTTTDYTGTVCQGSTCPDGPTYPLSDTTSYTYTPNGDLASVTTPPIVTLQNGRPTTGPVTTTYGYGTDGDLTSETSPNGTTTATSYNHLGQVIKVTQPAVPLWSGGNSSPVETTSYDPDGNVIKQVDAAGDVSVSSDDPLGRLVASTNPVSGTTVYTYSATEQTATQDPQGAVTQSSYDAAGRLSQTIDPSGALTQYGYDAAGNTTSITSMDSASTLLSLDTRQYDALNRVITDTVSGPGLTPQVTLTSYDPDGNVAQVQQPNGDVVFDTYTLADELSTEEVDPSAVMTATAPTFLLYSYDVVGNLSMVGDLDGRVTQNSFDAANRLVQSAAITGTTLITTTPQYDPDGNTLSQTRQTQVGSSPVQTHTITSTVNALDWTTSSSDDGLVTNDGYDSAGQERTEAVLGGTQPVTTTLDPEGRATSIADGLSGTVAYSYNADDLPLTVTLPGGLLEQPRYDGANRLTSLTLSGPPTASTPLSNTYSYGYNPLDWTTALTSTLNGITTTQVLTHDAAGRLIGLAGPGLTQSWSYDRNGNITNTLSNGVPTNDYYDLGVPNEVSKSQTRGQYTKYYAYDQTGDTTAITTTGSYSAALQYDSQARLIGVTFKSGQVVTMTYNAQGQRVSYAVSQPGQPSWSAQVQYRGDELGQAVIISGSQTYTDTYLYDQAGNPLELLRQQNGATSRYWYVLDGRGNVVALTDSNGSVVDRYAYDAWGAPISISETVPQRLRYAGYWYDSELGWYWVSVRSYDPVLKRWLQPDPSGQEGVRTFVYVGDDPVDASDPMGLGPGATQAQMCHMDKRYCNQDSHVSSFNSCNIWFIGYFICPQHSAVRPIQAALLPFGTYEVPFPQGGPVPLGITNASNREKDKYGTERAIELLHALGYEVRGRTGRGIDLVAERVGEPVISIPPLLRLRLQLYRWVVVEVKTFDSHFRMTRDGIQFGMKWILGSNRLPSALRRGGAKDANELGKQILQEGFGRLELRTDETGDFTISEYLPVSGTKYKIPRGLPPELELDDEPISE